MSPASRSMWRRISAAVALSSAVAAGSAPRCGSPGMVVVRQLAASRKAPTSDGVRGWRGITRPVAPGEEAAGPDPRPSGLERQRAPAVAALDGQVDEARHQRRDGQPAGLPHLRVHRNGREAGESVHLVDVEIAALAIEEE